MTSTGLNQHLVEFAAQCIKQSEALLITAGAGIGVDSGLPVFQGLEGLWGEYPYFRKAKMTFQDAASPRFFRDDPHKFWFFYGHRFNIYKRAQPHQGFADLLQIAKQNMLGNYFVFTSNVDNHFSKAGFEKDKIAECHGSIMHFQCSSCWDIFDADQEEIDICTDSFEAKSIPRCPNCRQTVRPNILMFGDSDWICDRTEEQEQRFRAWVWDNRNVPLTIIEAGAGVSVPTIRRISEDILTRTEYKDAPTHLIRINPRDQETRLVNPNDNHTQFLGCNATEECLKRAKSDKKARSVIQIKSSTKDAMGAILKKLKNT